VYPCPNPAAARQLSVPRHSFAADVETGKAQFMADSQVPWGVGALEGVSEPAWKKSSWYLVAMTG
jgi:hypothetical protein